MAYTDPVAGVTSVEDDTVRLTETDSAFYNRVHTDVTAAARKAGMTDFTLAPITEIYKDGNYLVTHIKQGQEINVPRVTNILARSVGTAGYRWKDAFNANGNIVREIRLVAPDETRRAAPRPARSRTPIYLLSLALALALACALVFLFPHRVRPLFDTLVSYAPSSSGVLEL